jgi:hypothetical protein
MPAAIEVLGGMFGDLPRVTLSMVLESHSGNMERTVDYLLGLSPQEMDALRASTSDLEVLETRGGAAAGLAGLAPVPSLVPPGIRSGDEGDEDDEGGLDADLLWAMEQSRRDAHGGRPVGAEEADFSRALEATQRALGDTPTDEADQEQSDAVLATMLQNQMLKQQLQQDRGFTSMLEGERSTGGGRAAAAPAVEPAPALGWGEMLGLWGGEETPPAQHGRRQVRFRACLLWAFVLFRLAATVGLSHLADGVWKW